MGDAHRDRRVVRSRRLLQDALVALILERGYAAVTVQAVLDRADVGRATFYAHFTSKEALLLSLFEGLRESLQRELAGITHETVARFGEGVGLLQPLFAHAAQNRRLYQALLRSRDGAGLLQELRAMLAGPLRAHLETTIVQHGRGVVHDDVKLALRMHPESAVAGSHQPSTAQVELVVTAFVSAVLGALVWWLEADLPYTPAEMDRIMERLMSSGVGGALGLHAEGAPVHRARRHDRALKASR
jgi:AcrR family transcriptional regulator